MNEIHISKALKTETPATLAKALGCTPAAIHKAVHRQRDIYIRMGKKGVISAYEVKTFPGGK